MPATLGELAQRFQCDFRGSSGRSVDRIATLSGADESSLSFLANPIFRPQLRETRAGVVILAPEFVDECPVDCLITANPYATFARVAAWLHPRPRRAPGIDPTAAVAPEAIVAETAFVGAQATIGARAVLGERVEIGAGSVVSDDAIVGEDTRLAERVVICSGVTLGRRCTIHPGAVIGADGFGFAQDEPEGWVKVPQIGGVSIGDDVEIGANTTVDRGTIEDTVIEAGVKLDNLVQIAHNVRIGEHTVMAAMSGAAGSTTIGKRCMIGGGAVLINHISVCDDVMFLFRSVVTKSVEHPGVYSGVLPAEEASQWRRRVARFRQLDGLAERLRRAERGLKALAGKGTP
jgi:UDP-3-O-[3-hydroxymyristoyl] glucosamine N-acyltransferase